MKKSLILMLLVAFAFIGNAQNRNNVPEKFYVFEYEYYSHAGGGMMALFSPTSGLQWYQTIDLYINGTHSSTFNIGNSIKVPMAWGFTVPVGSSWYLEAVKTEVTLNGMGYMPGIYYTRSGTAVNDTAETLMVTVEY